MAIEFGEGNLVWPPRPRHPEGVSLYKIPVKRTGDLSESLEISWAISFDGISSPGIGETVFPASPDDFESSLSGVLLFPAGKDQLYIALLIDNDSIPEPTEYFIVTVTDPSTGQVISDQFALVDDDTAILEIATDISSQFQVEGTGTGFTEFTFTVKRSGKTSGSCSVGWRVTGGEVDASDFENESIP